MTGADESESLFLIVRLSWGFSEKPGPVATFFRELHKIGHLDQSQVESQKLANPGQQKQVSIRIVVVSNGSDVEIRQLREGR